MEPLVNIAGEVGHLRHGILTHATLERLRIGEHTTDDASLVESLKGLTVTGGDDAQRPRPDLPKGSPLPPVKRVENDVKNLALVKIAADPIERIGHMVLAVHLVIGAAVAGEEDKLGELPIDEAWVDVRVAVVKATPHELVLEVERAHAHHRLDGEQVVERGGLEINVYPALPLAEAERKPCHAAGEHVKGTLVGGHLKRAVACHRYGCT